MHRRRPPLIAGNWKMYKGGPGGLALARACADIANELHHVEIVIAPPFTVLAAAAAECEGARIALAGQNVHAKERGAVHRRDQRVDAGGQRVHLGHRRPQRAAAALRRDRRAGRRQGPRGAGGGPHAHRLRRRDAGGARGGTYARGRPAPGRGRSAAPPGRRRRNASPPPSPTSQSGPSAPARPRAPERQKRSTSPSGRGFMLATPGWRTTRGSSTAGR